MGAMVSALLGVALSALVWYGASTEKGAQLRLGDDCGDSGIGPCTSPCCLVGGTIGIWALVVLMRPEVKSALQQFPESRAGSYATGARTLEEAAPSARAGPCRRWP
jgi:hypothetical protein